MTWRATLVGTVSALVLGFVLGFAVGQRWEKSKNLQEKLDQTKAELTRYRTAVGFSSELDDEAIKLEITNDDIRDAIIRKARTLGAVDTGQCVSADSMCRLSTLKLFTPPAPELHTQCGEDYRLALEKESETTELIARLRASEIKNARAVNDCKRFYAKIEKLWTGK